VKMEGSRRLLGELWLADLRDMRFGMGLARGARGRPGGNQYEIGNKGNPGERFLN
jgi:hypothetical protein